MDKKKKDYSIFEKFTRFERKPVGVKYSLDKPEGITEAAKELALCEAFKEAQTSEPFYITKVQCGEQVIGQVDYPPLMYTVDSGPMFSMFKNAGGQTAGFTIMCRTAAQFREIYYPRLLR